MKSTYLGENRVEVTLTFKERLKLLFGLTVNGYILVGKTVRDRNTGFCKTVETKYKLRLW